MPFFSASAPPLGTESAKNATLWGPPDTLMNRTVEPALIVSAADSNAALVVPFPVIFTSTTTASVAGAAGAAGAFSVPRTAAAAWDALGLLPAPQAPSSTAGTAASPAN